MSDSNLPVGFLTERPDVQVDLSVPAKVEFLVEFWRDRGRQVDERLAAALKDPDMEDRFLRGFAHNDHDRP